MTSCKMNPTIIEIDFYDYKIRMCMIDGTKMYLVSDLLRQYNEKNGTNKRFTDYLKLKQSQEVIEYMAKSVGENSPLRFEEGQNEQNSERENSHAHYESPLNEFKWYIPHVIQYITTSSSVGANKGYIVCEELLHACLMWADPAFACAVYRFLTRLREQDNDYLKRQIDELQNQCKVLANRHVPNDDDQQWYYILSYNFKDDKVHLYSNYCRLDRMENVIRENERKEQEEIYHLTSIPNGFAFRYMGYEDIMTVIKEYDGSPVGNQRAHFVVPRDKWDGKDIKKDIRWMLQRRRRLLGWRTDLDKEDKE